MIGELILSSYTYNDGRVAINNAFSSQTSFNSVSANTLTLTTISTGTPVASLQIDSSGKIISGSSVASPFQTLTDSPTIAWDYSLGANAQVTLGGNRTLSLSNFYDGCIGSIIMKQDGTGVRTISLSGTAGTHKVINGGGGSLLLTSSINAEDIASFIYRDSTTTFYWNIGYNYN